MTDHADVVVAHDYLTQRGGAERVALEIARGLAASSILTSVYAPSQTFDGFASFDVTESDHPIVRALRSDPRRALPFLARAWSNMPAVDADVLICSSSGWAHAAQAAPGTIKVVYCHNPARWLYQPEDYTKDAGLAVRSALKTLSPGLRKWDAAAASTADLYLANSTSVARRIKDAYGITAEVLHPPVSVDVDGQQVPVEGVEPGYFLTVGRARGYKGTASLIGAFGALGAHRLVIVGAEQHPDHPQNVTAVGRVSEGQLRWLYANARALVSVSREDFGLTPIEANAFGTPVLLLRAGGFLDSTDEGVSGSFIETPDVEAITTAVRGFRGEWDPSAIRRHAEQFSREAFLSRLQAAVTSVT